MGGTLPVVAKFAVRRLGGLGRGVGRLYAVNTLGAVVGVLAATFGLMEGLGLQGTTQAIAAVNFLVAGAAWLWGGQRAVASGEEAAKQTARSDRLLWGVLAGFALSGFAALGYEVAWMRLLMVSFSFNSHYEFSIVLVAFLSGLALGGWLGSRLLTRRGGFARDFCVGPVFDRRVRCPVRVGLCPFVRSCRADPEGGFVVGVEDRRVFYGRRRCVAADLGDGGHLSAGRPNLHATTGAAWGAASGI